MRTKKGTDTHPTSANRTKRPRAHGRSATDRSGAAPKGSRGQPRAAHVRGRVDDRRVRRPARPAVAAIWLGVMALLAACSGGVAENVASAPEPDVPEPCVRYADTIARCFGTPRLAEETKRSFDQRGKGETERAEQINRCEQSLRAISGGCK